MGRGFIEILGLEWCWCLGGLDFACIASSEGSK
ncbi:unnamed protein product [Tuber aestivum]|uniref:Uncharacterized protein n=1 Tax=Tuber aestivum TaxID=59557 RepID=A0A292PNZ6_9PEZI|nr:unnamed protein product [Tuber aestivum]